MFATGSVSNPNFPLFGPGEYMGNELDMDFNMLSEYLFNEEEGRAMYGTGSNAAGAGISSAVSLGSFSPSMMMDYAPHDISDHEGSSGEDDSHDPSSGSNKKGKSSKEGGGKNKDQLDRRRERNRVLARKTRLRKKFFYEVSNHHQLLLLLYIVN